MALATGSSLMMLALYRTRACSVLAVWASSGFDTSFSMRTCAFLVTCSSVRTVLACLCASSTLSTICCAFACIRAVFCFRALASLGTISRIRTIYRIRTNIFRSLIVICSRNSIHAFCVMRTCHVLVYSRLDVLRKSNQCYKRNGSQYY